MISGSAWKGCKAGLSPVTQHLNNQDCPNDSLSACPRERLKQLDAVDSQLFLYRSSAISERETPKTDPLLESVWRWRVCHFRVRILRV